MRVYVPINGNKKYTELALKNPSRLGHIISPSYYLRPKEGIPFVLDNDAFGCWKNGTPFDELAWLKMIEKVHKTGLQPEWCIIPDVVCDKEGTMKAWEIYKNKIPSWKKAFVLQDGMVIHYVPSADVYFVGGSTEFKWRTAKHWCSNLNRVHVGRVRSRRLVQCEEMGAESRDGSGWLRETVRGRPFRQLEAWLENAHTRQYNLFNLTSQFHKA